MSLLIDLRAQYGYGAHGAVGSEKTAAPNGMVRRFAGSTNGLGPQKIPTNKRFPVGEEQQGESHVDCGRHATYRFQVWHGPRGELDVRSVVAAGRLKRSAANLHRSKCRDTRERLASGRSHKLGSVGAVPQSVEDWARNPAVASSNLASSNASHAAHVAGANRRATKSPA